MKRTILIVIFLGTLITISCKPATQSTRSSGSGTNGVSQNSANQAISTYTNSDTSITSTTLTTTAITTVTTATQTYINGYHLYRIVFNSIENCYGSGYSYDWYNWGGYNLGDSVGATTIYEIELKWGGKWQENGMIASDSGQIGEMGAKISAGSTAQPVSTMDYSPWRAFDSLADVQHAYQSAANVFLCNPPYNAVSAGSQYIDIQLASDVLMEGFRIHGAADGTGPDLFYMQYSEDGSQWHMIENSKTEQSTKTPATVTFTMSGTVTTTVTSTTITTTTGTDQN